MEQVTNSPVLKDDRKKTDENLTSERDNTDEATAQLRKVGYKLPIIALTAYARKEDREYCLANGFDDHISKPINRQMLINSTAHLSGQRMLKK